MELLLNDLSIQEQFYDSADFRDALRRIIRYTKNRPAVRTRPALPQEYRKLPNQPVDFGVRGSPKHLHKTKKGRFYRG